MIDLAFADRIYPNPMRMPIAENNGTRWQAVRRHASLHLVHEAQMAWGR